MGDGMLIILSCSACVRCGLIIPTGGMGDVDAWGVLCARLKAERDIASVDPDGLP